MTRKIKGSVTIKARRVGKWWGRKGFEWKARRTGSLLSLPFKGFIYEADYQEANDPEKLFRDAFLEAFTWDCVFMAIYVEVRT